MYKSLFISSIFHTSIIVLSIFTLPFIAKQPLDIPPLVSVELIQISDKTNIPFAPKAKKIIEKVKKDKEKLVSEQAPPKKIKKDEKKEITPLYYFGHGLSYAEFEYAYYENAAISYYLSNKYEKALNYFTKVIDEFEINDGKSEFYKGILLIELDKTSQGCDYLLKSSKLGFAGGSIDAYNNFCN